MKSNKKKDIENIKKFFNIKSSRRDFLKWIGFSTASVTLAACKGPVIKSIPYVTKPEQITPGVPNYYASTMVDSFDMGCVLVKTREGRPIKIEPNKNSRYFNTTSVRKQSSLLSIYDEERLKHPYLKNKKCSWNKLDNYVISHLKNIDQKNQDIFILSSSFSSFSTKKIFQEFQKKYKKSQWITYDAISYSKVLNAANNIFGTRAIPFFNLERTNLIISFDADFLSDWSPENIEKYYTKNRNPEKSMSQHIQIESNMTITGANADIRIPKKPSEIKKILIEVYQKILFGSKPKNDHAQQISNLIIQKGSKSVIFADGDQETYELSFLINQKINSNSLKEKIFIFLKESNDEKFYEFLNKLEMNNVGALFIHDTDPIYSLPKNIRDIFKNNIKKIPLKVLFSMKRNETSNFVDILASTPHWLESWGDVNPCSDYYTLIQPTISSIFDTRQFQDSLMIWSDIKEKNYYEYLKKTWEKYIIPKSLDQYSFNKALYYGFLKTFSNKKKINNTKEIVYNKYRKKINYPKIKNHNKFELKLYTKIGIGDGYQYNNPWLHEFPDPITRTTWDNYLTISYFDAKKIKLNNWKSMDGSLNGNCVNIIQDDEIFIQDLPIFIQPGQTIGTLGLAFGYGKKMGKFYIGKNSYTIYKNFNSIQKNIKIQKTLKIHKFACVQLQNTTVGRDIIKETNINTFHTKEADIWNKKEKIYTHEGFVPLDKISSYLNKKKKEYKGHHFNLSIDLNACIGCGSCVIACHSENNVPIVGKDEVSKFRDMHWIRIDRYYSHNKMKNKKNSSYVKEDSENEIIQYPKVSFQPVMCQHCENAPCEPVCPVGATTHGKQGQNMMTYNRCIGTRYCANNCPYKVRRFNWFNYSNNSKFDFYMNNNLGKMILNPDVVVRTRGVMEKCSLCIQRTQFTINNAKKENKIIKDEEFETACSISCPTKAITFGDINDKTSVISNKIKDKRSYKLLEFIGINPNVTYLMKIRNNKE
ncbi:4Fe-4S dicluster domain-containing protein [Blattabacterium cuenoti]|uniref:4Fe-4S dicluster domain-containing protein n=1 Tax=Blattabacterium cuenoti TaxID=1653831 RepID=UPI00163D0DB9|nr:4Fe-4S dicluster domain-containing protein [Blattabacterium cuenoti]